MKLTEDVKDLCKKVQDIHDEWENATDEEMYSDGFNGRVVDHILKVCKDSKIFAGYEIYDIIMKSDGEEYSDKEAIELACDIAESMLRNEVYWEQVSDLDFRQDYSEWSERYNPVQDEEGDVSFETYSPYIDDARKLAEEFAKEQGTNLCQHIWTRVDGDDNADIVLNGWHAVNRIEYIVCQNPWGNGKRVDSGIYIEAKYN